ncbi:Type I inositol 1,4,5-trisphosphate 5-phosphatase, partial [Sarracenia purpurea var. burkii]
MEQSSRHRPQPEKSWAEICCFGCTCLQLFWPKVIMRKWLNISERESDYSADTDDNDLDSDHEEFYEQYSELRFRDDSIEDGIANDTDDSFPRLRRQKSETSRAHYINTKEIRVCVGTWNVGGKLPSDDLDIGSWLDIDDPADMYVIGFQEIIPLNAGNIFGAEDSRPVSRWENIIRETLNRIQPGKLNCKSCCDFHYPSRFKESDDAPDVEDEIVLESDSDREQEIHPLDEESYFFDDVRDGSVAGESLLMDSEATVSSDDALLRIPVQQDLESQLSFPKRLKVNCHRTENCVGKEEASLSQYNRKLMKALVGRERIGLSWPELPLDLLAKHVSDIPNSFKSLVSFKTSKSFEQYNSLKLPMTGDKRAQSETPLLAELNHESGISLTAKPQYVRVVSKQMVGIFLTIWVRRRLRKHIRNVKVSTVGVGVMGYIGNK